MTELQIKTFNWTLSAFGDEDTAKHNISRTDILGSVTVCFCFLVLNCYLSLNSNVPLIKIQCDPEVTMLLHNKLKCLHCIFTLHENNASFMGNTRHFGTVKGESQVQLPCNRPAKLISRWCSDFVTKRAEILAPFFQSNKSNVKQHNLVKEHTWSKVMLEESRRCGLFLDNLYSEMSGSFFYQSWQQTRSQEPENCSAGEI